MMTIYEIQNRDVIAPLFANTRKSFIMSYFQHYMGKGFADDLTNPQSALIIVGEFYYFAGTPNVNWLRYKPQGYLADSAIMIPPNKQWSTLIEQYYSQSALKFTRYAFKSHTQFDVVKLENIVNQLSTQYQLKMIDRSRYNELIVNDWAKDLCIHFPSYEVFEQHGIGVVALKEGNIVSGASSYIAYKNGIEVEIDTKQSERHKGLALVCGAKLIIECLRRHIYPNWDAHNQASRSLAEKLGYCFDYAYPAYTILDF